MEDYIFLFETCEKPEEYRGHGFCMLGVDTIIENFTELNYYKLYVNKQQYNNYLNKIKNTGVSNIIKDVKLNNKYGKVKIIIK